MHSTPKALDLCAGAGGLSLGLQRAGFDVLGIELDADAIDTHRRHVGPCEASDLRTYHPDERRDLTAGGVPCQPFSAAGLGLGLDDPRYLVPDFLRIAREAGSRAVMLENVRGLVQRPRDLRAVLDLFEAEYLTTWTVLDAADYGVPQHRDRLFVVGFKDPAARARFRWPLPSHAPPGDLLRRPPYRTVREALSLPARPFRAGRVEGASGWQGMRLLDVDAPGFAIGTRNNADLLDRPAPCVTATEQKSAMSGSQPMSRRRRASERLSEALGALDRPAPTIKANSWHEGTSARPSQRPAGELARALEAAGLADRPAPSSQGDPRLAVAGHHDRQQNGAVRLTPEQCALLQGFPAGWTWTGNKGSRHRQIGNAVPPALAEAMGHAVKSALYG
jgi:site-specific DNA-cytosine methylase